MNTITVTDLDGLKVIINADQVRSIKFKSFNDNTTRIMFDMGDETISTDTQLNLTTAHDTMYELLKDLPL